ncbi:hypothetical protein JL722_8997 [Aureococcus anophagefferens]|nr:hypothetical protein JL722_8997 [Aureococcus anophagefferens]
MAAHVANINDSETHSDEDESDGGLDDLLGIGSLDCASESEEDEAPLFARRDADLGALLDADRYFAVVDGAVDAASARRVADALPVPCARAAAIKVQRNDGGAFPAHYDNAGPPSKRAVTAVLYFGAEAGGDLVLAGAGKECSRPSSGAASPYRRGGTASRSSARTACSTG